MRECKRRFCELATLYAVAAFVAAQVYNGQPVDAAAPVESSAESSATDNDFITQTVYGFLDFTTTIGNTVMVFSPQSAPAGKNTFKRISLIIHI